MKTISKLYLSALALSLALMPANMTGKTAANVVETPASDSRITFIGRTQVHGDSVSFDWTGVYARVKFEGTYIAARVSDTRRNYYEVWLDAASTADKPDKTITTHGKDSLIVLFDDADFTAKYGKKAHKGPHQVVILKRTEGEQGTTTFSKFITHGNLLQADGIKARQIEFIGDSYTCGYGTEGKSPTERFSPATENANLSYAAIVGRYFNADYFVVAHSGWGIARNYNDNMKGDYMSGRYMRTFDCNENVQWDSKASNFKPAITVILLGTNDFSTGRQPTLAAWKTGYLALLKEIKANYGDKHPILCTAARGDMMVFDYVRAAVEASGMENVSFMCYGPNIFLDAELGSDYHPNYDAHRKIAHSVIPYISTMAGWPISDNIK